MALMADVADGETSLRADLPSITCPTTVIVGEHDHPLVDQAPDLAAEVADGRLTVIQGAYHSPQLTHPDAWRAAVRGPPRLGRRVPEAAVTDAAPPQASDRIALAGSDVAIPPLGVGTWAWGDKGTWGMGGYDQSLTEASIREAWEASIEAGVVLFDTAEVYGGGESERIIGRLLAADPGVRDRVVIATKFMPSPWKLNVHSALLASAARQSRRAAGDRVHRPLPDPRPDLAALARRHGRGPGRRAGRGTGARRSACPTTRPRRPGASTPRCADAACAWPATRSSSPCCARCRSGSGSSTAAASSASSPWRTRRSGRGG